MHIALKANNGKYIAAEEGGGIVGLSLRANRDTIGPWETFEFVRHDNNSVSFKTCNGFYLTAEEGGGAGISTNRKEANAWEKFFITDVNGSDENFAILCQDGVHYICAELGSDASLNATRTKIGPWETFKVEWLDNPEIEWPGLGSLRDFKGNLCGMPLNLDYAPRGILFTPSYVVYNDKTRDRIRKAYQAEGLTHFPLNLTNHSSIYRSCYPHWNDSLINQYLEELLDDSLIPVGFVMGDNDIEVDCKADPSLVPIVVPKWEDSSPLRGPNLDQYNTFHLVKEKYPNSMMYWHNPIGQGAPFVKYAEWGMKENDPGINAKVWNYMVKDCSVVGLLFQGQAWKDNGAASIAGLGDFTVRLKDNVNGWPTADLVDFEETAYYMFNMDGDYNLARNMTLHIRSSVQRLNGFCNG